MSYVTEISLTGGQEKIVFDQDFTGNLVLFQAYIIPRDANATITKKELIGDGTNFYEINGSLESVQGKAIEIKPKILSSPYRVVVQSDIDTKVLLIVIVYNAGPVPSLV